MSIGYIKDGKYIRTAGTISFQDFPIATESSDGLFSSADKMKLDATYDSSDVASSEDISKEIFGK